MSDNSNSNSNSSDTPMSIHIRINSNISSCSDCSNINSTDIKNVSLCIRCFWLFTIYQGSHNLSGFPQFIRVPTIYQGSHNFRKLKIIRGIVPMANIEISGDSKTVKIRKFYGNCCFQRC